MEENSRTRGGNMPGLLFWKKKCLETGTEEAQREFLSDRKGKIITRAEDGKDTGTNSGKSGTRDLEAESVGSRWSVWSM